ncbi:MAG: glycoside hydrolase family 5 protein, partial [Cyclobacteriaceae bacterium]|nr:glycoside hydrolase family 5 protein [Cyclobacteriaceae bacterium]
MEFKKLLSFFWFLLSFFLSQHLTAQDAVPFTRGINLTGWFQKSGVQQIQISRYTKQDFEQIKSLGCDVIRLPINLHYMTYGGPNYVVNPLFFEFLDQVVDYCEELGLYLILDNHTFSPSENTDPNIGQVLEKVWRQVAQYYQNRSGYLMYEVLNEPHGITDKQWNDIQKGVIAAIRSVDTKHTIVIGPAGWNSFNNLAAMPVYDDDNLIYTFHFYDPFLFTHQGASWVNPSMVPLSGVPFPYSAGSMPALPVELKGSWIESSYNAYANTGTVSSVK